MESTKSTKYKLEKLPTFPRTLLDFKHYDGWKTLMVISLIITGVYLILGLIGYGLDHNPWLRELLFDPQPEVVNKQAWWKFWSKPIGSAAKEILNGIDILFRALIFLCSYCLTWAAFDRKNIEGYIMGFFNMVVGMIYILSPTDIIPDIFPIVGSIDDTIFSTGTFLLGAYFWNRNSLREHETKTILSMVERDDQNGHHNLEKALQLMLEDRGVHIEFLEGDEVEKLQ